MSMCSLVILLHQDDYREEVDKVLCFRSTEVLMRNCR